MELIPTETGGNRDEQGRFVEGVSGNPNGRPPGTVSVVEALRRKLKEFPIGQEKTYLEQFIDKIFQKTIVEGDVQMMRDLINRIDGMPQQSMDMTTKGQPIIQIANEVAQRYAITDNCSGTDSTR